MSSLPQYLWRSIVDSRQYPDERQEHAINTEMARCLACVYYFLFAVIIIGCIHDKIQNNPPSLHMAIFVGLFAFIHLYITGSTAYLELIMRNDTEDKVEYYLSRLAFYSAGYTLLLIAGITVFDLFDFFLRDEKTLPDILRKNIIVGGLMGMYLHRRKEKLLMQILERKQAEKDEAPAG